MPGSAVLLLTALLAAGSGPGPAAGTDQPAVDEPGNRIVLELAPSAANPRNSEGAFLTLRDGRLLFSYTRFTGGGADDAAADIAAVTSADGGLTWTDPSILVRNTGRQNVMSSSFLRLKDGRTALFYLRKNGPLDCRMFLQTSDDEGATWSEPVSVTTAQGYFVVNNDRIIQLRSGRLVVPAAYHRTKGPGEKSGRDILDYRAVALFYLSDDGGRTWRESTDWWTLPVPNASGLQEPGAVELRDGRLFAWARTDVGRQYGMESRDGGEHWTPPVPTDFVSPNSPLSMKRIPATGDLLAVWNDRSGRFPLAAVDRFSWGRNPLVAAVSKDDGLTWTNHRLVEGDHARGYCYTAIHFVGDQVLLAYCAGGKDDGGILNRLRIRRVDVAWFTR